MAAKADRGPERISRPLTMQLTINTMMRLASRGATEAHLFVEILGVECDSNLVWEITFVDESSTVMTVFVDAHDFNTEDHVVREIEKQLLDHLPSASQKTQH